MLVKKIEKKRQVLFHLLFDDGHWGAVVFDAPEQYRTRDELESWWIENFSMKSDYEDVEAIYYMQEF